MRQIGIDLIVKTGDVGGPFKNYSTARNGRGNLERVNHKSRGRETMEKEIWIGIGGERGRKTISRLRKSAAAIAHQKQMKRGERVRGEV